LLELWERRAAIGGAVLEYARACGEGTGVSTGVGGKGAGAARGEAMLARRRSGTGEAAGGPPRMHSVGSELIKRFSNRFEWIR
jgi:hypothetical protein